MLARMFGQLQVSLLRSSALRTSHLCFSTMVSQNSQRSLRRKLCSSSLYLDYHRANSPLCTYVPSNPSGSLTQARQIDQNSHCQKGSWVSKVMFPESLTSLSALFQMSNPSCYDFKFKEESPLIDLYPIWSFYSDLQIVSKDLLNIFFSGSQIPLCALFWCISVGQWSANHGLQATHSFLAL